MSDATLDAVRAALTAHVADERGPGNIVTEYVAVIAYVDADPDVVKYMTCTDGPTHAIEGLARLAVRDAEGRYGA